MTIYHKNIKDAGACNFCQRAELTKKKIGLKYPYKKVYCIMGNSILICICQNCMNEIKGFKNNER